MVLRNHERTKRTHRTAHHDRQVAARVAKARDAASSTRTDDHDHHVITKRAAKADQTADHARHDQRASSDPTDRHVVHDHL